MTRSIVFTTTAAALCLASVTPLHAASKEEQKMMKLFAECAYVMKVAEGAGAKLRNSAAVFEQAKAGYAVKWQMDPANADAEARAKYKKRERVMGAQEAMKKLISRARECDAQL